MYFYQKWPIWQQNVQYPGQHNLLKNLAVSKKTDHYNIIWTGPHNIWTDSYRLVYIVYGLVHILYGLVHILYGLVHILYELVHTLYRPIHIEWSTYYIYQLYYNGVTKYLIFALFSAFRHNFMMIYK